MNKSNIIDTLPQNTIQDISFDWHGSRLAASSSDKYIRIYVLKKDEKWYNQSTFVAHDGPITKVKWANPNYGSMIATASQDQTIIIWLERKIMNKTGNQERKWEKKSVITESKGTISDIKFFSYYDKLSISVATSEGAVKLYKPNNYTDFGEWTCYHDKKFTENGINTITWCKNKFLPPSFSISCKENKSLSASNHPVKEKMLFLCTKTSSESQELNFSKFAFEFKDPKKNSIIHHCEEVYDVSWCNDIGRSFELIASCGKDGVIVWYVQNLDHELLDSEIIFRKAFRLNPEENISVWRVSWNIAGSILAASDEKNSINFYKKDGIDNWKKLQGITEGTK